MLMQVAGGPVFCSYNRITGTVNDVNNVWNSSQLKLLKL